MNQKFNFFGEHEDYNIKLCNPDKKVLAFLNFGYDKVVTLRFNEMSEFKMKIPLKIGTDDNGKALTFPFYSSVQSKKLILVEGIGYFLINSVERNGNGIEEYKTITAYSLEAELGFKKINLLDGTYNFYDPINPEKTIMGNVLSNTNWKIGTIDPALIGMYRTFEIPDTTVYEFLLNDMETTFECIFQFDTLTRTVSAYAVQNILYPTSIILSYNNLIKDIEVVEKSDEIVTALNVYGADDISIATVNPLGTPTMYNFSYYKNINWMSQGLITALTNWENKVNQSKPTYASTLSQLKTQMANRTSASGTLATLQADASAKEGVVKTMIEGGQQSTPAYTAAVNAWNAAVSAVSAQQSVVNNYQAQINVLNSNLKSINDSLSFINNFTKEQYEELTLYVIENTYQDGNFVITSTMTDSEAQDMVQSLYDQAAKILEKLSGPRYTFSVNSINFIFLKEYIPFTSQLRLGCIMNVEDESSNTMFQPVLLQMEFQLDDPSKFELTFGNRYRLDSGEYTFKDLFGDAIKAGSSVKFDSSKWGEYVNSGMNDTISQFISSALDCAKNNVINATNQEIIINENGLRGRNYISPDVYSGNQVWLTSNTLAFTKDNWTTCSLALGEITLGDKKVFGLVADAIVGRLIAGNNLIISNENSSFVVDGNTATLTNATFNVTKTSGNIQTTISIDPSNGFLINSRNLGEATGTNVFSIGIDGSINASARISISGNADSVGGIENLQNSTFVGTTFSGLQTIAEYNSSYSVRAGCVLDIDNGGLISRPTSPTGKWFGKIFANCLQLLEYENIARYFTVFKNARSGFVEIWVGGWSDEYEPSLSNPKTLLIEALQVAIMSDLHISYNLWVGKSIYVSSMKFVAEETPGYLTCRTANLVLNEYAIVPHEDGTVTCYKE